MVGHGLLLSSIEALALATQRPRTLARSTDMTRHELSAGISLLLLLCSACSGQLPPGSGNVGGGGASLTGGGSSMGGATAGGASRGGSGGNSTGGVRNTGGTGTTQGGTAGGGGSSCTRHSADDGYCVNHGLPSLAYFCFLQPPNTACVMYNAIDSGSYFCCP